MSDAQRAALAALAAFLQDQGLSAGLLGAIEVVQADQQRNQTIGTVPTRENLEKFRPKSPEEVNDALSEPPRGDYRVEQAPTGMWCVYGPDGSKLGEFATRAEANARVAEAKEAMQEPAGRAAAVEADVPQEEVSAELLAETQPKERAANLHLQVFHMPTGMLAGWTISDFSNNTFEHFGTRKECLARLEAITDSEAEKRPWTETVRHGIAEVAGQFAVWDAERDTFQRFDTREAAEHRLAALLQVSGEQPDEATALQRLEIVTADLSRAQAERNSAIERATAAEAEVKRLENTPARERPVKYGGPGLERTFLANLGGEGAAEVARLRKEYADAEAEAKAERQGDVDKRNRALERMLRCQGELAEHGVFL